jgi:GNAT superfamily N-acetyltransferase
LKSEIIIRKANLKDLDELIKVWVKFMKVHDTVVIKKNPKLKEHLSMKHDSKDKWIKFAKRMIYSKRGLLLVVEESNGKNKKILGYSLTFIKKNIKIYKIEKIGYISDMYVEPKYQGKGLSSKLSEETFKWLKSKGIKHVELTVFSDNIKAHSIYKHWKFFDYSVNMRMKI